MRKYFNKIAALLLALLLTGGVLPISLYAAEREPVKLTVVHINDAHGRTQAEPYISQLKKDIKAGGGNVLVLDAGDRLHGQTAANLSKGRTMVGIMNTAGYDAMTPGNHDFNFGVERLLELSEEMDFPLLAANVTRDGKNLFQPYAVFPLDGVTVGVFGLATPATMTMTDPRIVAGLTFEDPVQTAEAMVAALKDEGCEVIIALAHLGVEASSLPQDRSDALAAIPGIDVVIDGHSHTVLENGMRTETLLIAQTGKYGENIGVVELTIESGAVKEKSARLIPVSGELKADEAIALKITEEEKAIEPITSNLVGHTPVLLQGEREYVRTSETNLSDLITDSMRYVTGADTAIMNGGGIRASIPAGDITTGDVLSVLPFSNLIVKMELSGAELLEALENGVSLYPGPAGRQIQVSGITFEFDPDAEPMRRVTKAAAGGAPIDPDRTYTVATIDFLAAGGDGYTSLANGKNLQYYGADSEALIAYLATNPDIRSEPANRVRAAAEQPVPLPGEASESKPETAGDGYIIQPGDTLSRIAGKYGTTYQELARLNNIQNPSLIYAGQRIILPCASQPTRRTGAKGETIPTNDITSFGGADMYVGMVDIPDSPYFIHNNYYEWESNDTLTILPRFKTYQQTSEWSCGNAVALMALNYFGVEDYTEWDIAEAMGSHTDADTPGAKPGTADNYPEFGTDVKQMTTFFETVNGITVVESSYKAQYELSDLIPSSDATPDHYTGNLPPAFSSMSMYTSENSDESTAYVQDAKDSYFVKWLTGHLKNGNVIMVEWADWGGHWMAIVGYDNCGTPAVDDDILIFADPYDISDHWQDGYMIYPLTRWFCLWDDFKIAAKPYQIQPYLVVGKEIE